VTSNKLVYRRFRRVRVPNEADDFLDLRVELRDRVLALLIDFGASM
jgi:hypothetical protein